MSYSIEFYSNVIQYSISESYDNPPSLTIYENQNISYTIDPMSLGSIDVGKIKSRQAQITILVNPQTQQWLIDNIANNWDILEPHKPLPGEDEGLPTIKAKYLKTMIKIERHNYIGIISIASISYDSKTKILKFTAYDILSLLEMSVGSLSFTGSNTSIHKIDTIKRILKESLNYSMNTSYLNLNHLSYADSNLEMNLNVDNLKVHEWNYSSFENIEDRYVDAYRFTSEFTSIVRIYFTIVVYSSYTHRYIDVKVQGWSRSTYYVNGDVTTHLETYNTPIVYTSKCSNGTSDADMLDAGYLKLRLKVSEILPNYNAIDEDDNIIFDDGANWMLKQFGNLENNKYYLYYSGLYDSEYITVYKEPDVDVWEFKGSELLKILLLASNKVLYIDGMNFIITDSYNVNQEVINVPFNYIKSFKSLDYRFEKDDLNTEILLDSEFLTKISNTLFNNVEYLKMYELIIAKEDYRCGDIIRIENKKYVIYSKNKKKIEYTYNMLKIKENE